MSNSQRKGKIFQKQVLQIASQRLGLQFYEEHSVLIGNPPRPHKFDVVDADQSVIIECKCYSWRSGNKVPSAKISTLNEAALYMQNISQNTNARKIIVMSREINSTSLETLAEYYVKHYGHLLGNIEVWEVDMKTGSPKKLK